MVSHVVHFLSDMERGSQFCEMSLLANIHTPASEDVQSYPMLALFPDHMGGVKAPPMQTENEANPS